MIFTNNAVLTNHISSAQTAYFLTDTSQKCPLVPGIIMTEATEVAQKGWMTKH